MKKTLFCFFTLVLAASAQYTVVPGTSYPALETTLNAKPAMRSGAGAPAASCTSTLDFYTRTSNSHLYLCYPANTWVDITGAGGDALVANPLSQFAATTSAQLAAVLTNETGTGAVVYNLNPNIIGPTGIVKADVGLGNVDNTSDATKNAAAVTLTNHSISGGQITSAVATATALAANGTNCSAGSYPLGVDASGNSEGCTVAASGSGITSMTTGASDPVAACAAPSVSVLVLYTQTTTQDIWACVATNTWKKILSTTNTGTYIATGTTGTAPSNPASGDVTCYYSSVSLTQVCLDSSGNASTMMKVANRTDVKSLWLDSPVIGDSYRLIFEEGKAITITRVSCNVIGGTNAVINLMKTTEATSGSGGTAALTSDLTCTAGAVVASTTFTSAGVAARTPVALKLTSLSGTNTDLHVWIEYLVD